MDSDEIDLFGLLASLWGGKLWLILSCVICVFIAGYYVTKVAVPMYSASTTVALENREQNPMGDIANVMSGLSTDQSGVNTEIEVFRSRTLIGKLVRELDLINDPEFNTSLQEETAVSAAIRRVLAVVKGSDEEPVLSDQAIFDRTVTQLLTASISVSNVRQSLVFQVSSKTTSAEKSAKIVDTLAELYIRDKLDIRFSATERATGWLTERVGELKTELEIAETKAREFNSNTDLISPDALSALTRQRKELSDRLDATRANIESNTARLKTIENLDAGRPAVEIADELADRALVVTARRVRDGVLPASAFDQALQGLRDRLLAEQDRDQGQAKSIEQSIADLEIRVERQSGDLITLQQLEREAEAARLIYEYFLTRLKETGVQQGIQTSDARVLSYAVVPQKPVEPRKSLVVSLAGVIGLFIGAAFVLGREMLNRSFRTPDELEKFSGVTVMGQIPKGPAGSRKQILKYMIDNPASALSEAIRNLRTSLLLSNIDNPARLIMLTSSLPGEGKTTQSLGLSQNIAAMGKKVLLIEADIRRRTLNEYFDVSKERGLISVVSGEAPLSEVVFRSPGLDFDILLGEKSRLNAADFFSSESFIRFLKQAKDTYDFIIIDTPPVLAVPDARVIAPHCDAVLYVVRWDVTTKVQVQTGLRAFATVNVQVNGLVLNQIDPKGMKRYGYGEDYGKFSAYGTN